MNSATTRFRSSIFRRGTAPVARLAAAVLGVLTLGTAALVVAPALGGPAGASSVLSIRPTSLPVAMFDTPDDVTLHAAGGRAPYTFTLAAGTLPTGLTFDGSTGVLSGTPTVVGTSPITVTVADSSSPARTGQASYNLVVTLQPTGTTLPAANAGWPVSDQLTAAGGSGDYTFTKVRMPGGLSVSPGGLLTGTLQRSGADSVVVEIADAANPTATVRGTYTFATQIGATPVVLPSDAVGTPYSVQLAGSGGTAPYRFSSPDLPSWLTLSTGGMLSGTPASDGTAAFSLDVADSSTPVQDGSVTETLEVGLLFDTTKLPPGNVGQPYTATIDTGGAATEPVACASPGLPAGLALGPGATPDSCTLSGAPTVPGHSDVTVTATDASSPPLAGAVAYSFSVLPLGISPGPGTVSSGPPGSPVDVAFGATGGTGEYTFTSSDLSVRAPFLSLSPSGQLTGTLPTNPGTYAFAVTVTDTTRPRSLSLTETVSVKVEPAA